MHRRPSFPPIKLVGPVVKLILALCWLSTFLVSQPSRLIRVPGDRPTIQSAVDRARVGDTVLVDEGRYVENVRINKNIVVASRFILDRDTSHISRTVIDGSRPADKRHGSVVTITGGTDTTCVVMGFTILNGTGSQVFVKGMMKSFPAW
ncbi:MAG TPA: hypothetical protein VJB38_10680 [Bacteroidota bacterium]|nr:hypothetical protein [Bacteroidota bacterium]